VFGTISNQTVSVFGKKKPSDEHVQKLAKAEQTLADVRQRLKQLGR
jgi:hypothetical protein